MRRKRTSHFLLKILYAKHTCWAICLKFDTRYALYFVVHGCAYVSDIVSIVPEKYTYSSFRVRMIYKVNLNRIEITRMSFRFELLVIFHQKCPRCIRAIMICGPFIHISMMYQFLCHYLHIAQIYSVIL